MHVRAHHLCPTTPHLQIAQAAVGPHERYACDPQRASCAWIWASLSEGAKNLGLYSKQVSPPSGHQGIEC